MNKPVVSLVLAVACAPAWAGEAAPIVDKLVACAEVQDSRQRLSCFDREIAPFAKPKTASVPAPPPRAPAAAEAAPAVIPPARPTPSLGQEQLSSKSKPPVQEEDVTLHARITTLRTVGASAYVVSLDNGQAWRHEDQTQGAYLREGEAITIRKATLGSYRLTRDAGESKNWIRVTRVR